MVQQRAQLKERQQQEQRAREGRIERAHEKFKPAVNRNFDRLVKPTKAQAIRAQEVLHGEKEEKDSFTFLRPPRRFSALPSLPPFLFIFCGVLPFSSQRRHVSFPPLGCAGLSQRGARDNDALLVSIFFSLHWTRAKVEKSKREQKERRCQRNEVLSVCACAFFFWGGG